MAQIKTVTTTSGENTITFDSFYPFVWIRNAGDNDITAANYSGASAGDENTVSVKAGEVAMIQAETENVYIVGATTAEIHAQGFAECPFKRGLKGGEQIDVTALSVTANGTYTAPTGTAYSPVVVDVQEQPWAPLEDGYSNFWFELTNDTLSPWLNFSAKNNDAVIDWGDGSGEVALDTLTPTHTYAKAGRYVVKCKGVTETAIMFSTSTSHGNYYNALKAIELNSEFRVINYNSFINATGLGYAYIHNGLTDIRTSAFEKAGLKKITIPNSVTTFFGAFNGCALLEEITIPSAITSIANSAFAYCYALKKVMIPSGIATIGSNAFYTDLLLREVHIAATTPPTISSGVFASGSSYYIIYVPVGTGETYKAAAGWSAYSDHILEEGQTVTRAMQRKFAKEAKANEEDTGDMR